ncbi:aspartyl-phosphate phosphatase Spo0E family protein [Evansella sp. AB-P1]|uniref:aspartyl-phosphate phosphatase Spo0E family protein n=1 Tax=Evansella sp. AB-P1 TaxID=3037653 RepID=UPI00241F2FB4|nr:aspartyl-phosphate phosphatase Spo0E family protein [Evansella sp. AB-P1]MDG5788378.1 aspartyl-phosphate phosphatase Spo0E family protein [Evansella sp. AB-P1]
MYNGSLLLEIKTKQEEMYEKAMNYGFTDSRVVSCSQDLDVLLNKYQGLEEYIVLLKQVQEHSEF